LKRFHDVVTAQGQAFQAGRIRQLEARVAESNSEIAGAVSRREEAAANLKRASSLAQTGIQSQAALDRAVRDHTVAVEAENALRKRLAGTEIELNAAREGVFIGDSYNDQPSSFQRANETTLRIDETQAELETATARLARLRAEQIEETARYADLAAADLAAPIRGRIWEVLTAPGEEVRRGQDLLRLLDCSAAVVTTAVSEKVFNRLQFGDTARFRLANDPENYEGKIIHLSGMAMPFENLAIPSAALPRDTFRVTVSIPNIKGGCAIGRSGRVVFAPTVPGDASLDWRTRAVELGLQ
jgi:multidrug resistance efflux pump